MRDQIIAGINAARTNATRGTGTPYLAHLTDQDVDALATEILTRLAQVPTGTPEPVVSVTPAATPTLVLSPALVVAHSALDALNEAQTDEGHIDTDHMGAGDDYREFREFLFRVQALYGVRVRSITRDDTPWFVVAGTGPQRAAFGRMLRLMHDLAEPVVADLDAEQRREFWATLGVLVAEGSDDADHLHESNREAFDAATAHLNAEYGPARNLSRATPASSGSVYDLASGVVAAQSQS